MQAVVCHGPEDYRLEDVAGARAGPGEALVRVEAVGICASDLKCYHGAAKFWGDENRPAWAETEVIPGHEFVGRVVELDDEAAERWGIEVGDRVVVRADRAVLGMPLLRARPVPHVPAPRHVRLQAREPGRHGGVHGATGRGAGAQDQQAISPAPRRVRRAAVLRAARGRAGQITFDDVVVVAGCGPIGLGMIAGAAAKFPAKVVALDMAPESSTWPRAAAPTMAINIAEEDAGRGGQGADRRLRRRRLPRGHRPPVRRAPGPQPAAQAGPVRRVQRLQERRHRRLVHHQRRQGARRARRPPRPALLARRDPDASSRVCCRWTRSAPTSCRWPNSRRASTWSASGKESIKVSLIPA